MSSGKMLYNENNLLRYNDHTMNWNERIKALRLRKHLSQEEFAEKGQVSLATVRAIESDTRKPSVIVFENLIKGVNCSLEEFFEIPKLLKFANPGHESIHHKLQDIFDIDPDSATSIRQHIELAWGAIEAKQVKSKASRKTG
jgi:transcriptional regulator with XRE-family HTH domain